MAIYKTTVYVITNEANQRGFAYPDQGIQIQKGNKVMFKAIVSEDVDRDMIVGVENIPIKNYVVDNKREEELLKYGYYGKDVITVKELFKKLTSNYFGKKCDEVEGVGR